MPGCRPDSTLSPGRRPAVATVDLGSTSVDLRDVFSTGGGRLCRERCQAFGATPCGLCLSLAHGKALSSQLLALFHVSLHYSMKEMRGGLERLGEDLVSSVVFWEGCSDCLTVTT